MGSMAMGVVGGNGTMLSRSTVFLRMATIIFTPCRADRPEEPAMNILQISSSQRRTRRARPASPIASLRACAPTGRDRHLTSARRRIRSSTDALGALFTPSARTGTGRADAPGTCLDRRDPGGRRHRCSACRCPNFGVPAQLKNWIDAIARAGVTFRFRQRPRNSCAAKKVLLARTHARRAGTGRHYRNTPADTQVPYLETVLAFLGMDDVQFIYAEGLALSRSGNPCARRCPCQIDDVLAGGSAGRVTSVCKRRPVRRWMT